MEVRHAGLFELVPQSARDDVHGDVVSDDPADAGQGRLDRTETRRASVRPGLDRPSADVLTHIHHSAAGTWTFLRSGTADSRLRRVHTHQLSSDGQTGTVFLRQLHLDGFGVLDGLQGSGQVIWSYLQTDLIVLRRDAFHLVLIKEVHLGGQDEQVRHHQTSPGFLMTGISAHPFR